MYESVKEQPLAAINNLGELPDNFGKMLAGVFLLADSGGGSC
jgi:hypothetical protein